MQTLSEVLKKHDINIMENIENINGYVVKFPNHILKMDSIQLNDLTYETVLKLLNGGNSVVRHLIENWNGVKTAEFYFTALIKTDSFINEIHYPMANAIMTGNDPSKMIYDIILEAEKYDSDSHLRKVNSFFSYLNDEDYHIIFTDKLVKKAIELNIHDELFMCISTLTDNMVKIINDNLELIYNKDGGLGSIPDVFFDEYKLSDLTDCKYKIDVIYKIIYKANNNRRLRLMMKIESYVPNLFELIETKYSSIYAPYRIYKKYGFEIDKMCAYDLIKLSHAELVDLCVCNRNKITNILLTKEFVENCEYDLKHFIHIATLYNLNAESVYKKLIDNIDLLSEVISVNGVFSLKTQYNYTTDEIKVILLSLNAIDLAFFINRKSSVDEELIILLDTLLCMDKNNFKMVQRKIYEVTK